jgi:hypothetical protein
VCVKRDGRFSGEAFVVVANTSQVQAAMDKNKSYMGRRYVEVFRARKMVGSWRAAARSTARGREGVWQSIGWIAGAAAPRPAAERGAARACGWGR